MNLIGKFVPAGRPLRDFTIENKKFKKFLLTFMLCVLFSFSSISNLNAGFTLKVSYRVDVDLGDLEDSSLLYSRTSTVGSNSAVNEKKKFLSLSKTAPVKSKLMSACRASDSYLARIKVTDARGGTAGLGNLKSVSLANIQLIEHIVDLPDYTDEESEALEEQYYYYADYPDFLEDGYVYYSIEATCVFSGTVSLITSNAYRIFINGDAGPEYSKTELARMKWNITLVDV